LLYIRWQDSKVGIFYFLPEKKKTSKVKDDQNAKKSSGDDSPSVSAAEVAQPEAKTEGATRQPDEL
jgi:hypothetical protein